MAKRVRLGKGWRVYREETGQLLPVLAGHIVKPGEICERDDKYFRLSKKGLKQINPRKGRVLTESKVTSPQFGVPAQPKRWKNDSYDTRTILRKNQALNKIKKECRTNPALRLKAGKIEVLLEGEYPAYVNLRNIEIRNDEYQSEMGELTEEAIALNRAQELLNRKESKSLNSRIRAYNLLRSTCATHRQLTLNNDEIEVISETGKRYFVNIRSARVRDSGGQSVCVVIRQGYSLPSEDIALAKALAIAYGSYLINTVR
ncbi:MAG: hypothetical protein ACFFCZ_06155 [Promethearchaeota archaeon]